MVLLIWGLRKTPFARGSPKTAWYLSEIIDITTLLEGAFPL